MSSGYGRPYTAVKFKSGFKTKGSKQRPRTTKFQTNKPSYIQSARHYFKNKDKGGEIDYEIELLNNLLNSEYTGT